MTSSATQRSPADGIHLAATPTTLQRMPGWGDFTNPGEAGDAGPNNAGNAGNSGNAGIAGNASNAGGVGALPDRDLETIAHKLYPRLLRRLSSELLVARERAGMLADHH